MHKKNKIYIEDLITGIEPDNRKLDNQKETMDAWNKMVEKAYSANDAYDLKIELDKRLEEAKSKDSSLEEINNLKEKLKKAKRSLAAYKGHTSRYAKKFLDKENIPNFENQQIISNKSEKINVAFENIKSTRERYIKAMKEDSSIEEISSLYQELKDQKRNFYRTVKKETKAMINNKLASINQEEVSKKTIKEMINDNISQEELTVENEAESKEKIKEIVLNNTSQEEKIIKETTNSKAKIEDTVKNNTPQDEMTIEETIKSKEELQSNITWDEIDNYAMKTLSKLVNILSEQNPDQEESVDEIVINRETVNTSKRNRRKLPNRNSIKYNRSIYLESKIESNMKQKKRYRIKNVRKPKTKHQWIRKATALIASVLIIGSTSTTLGNSSKAESKNILTKEYKETKSGLVNIVEDISETNNTEETSLLGNNIKVRQESYIYDGVCEAYLEVKNQNTKINMEEEVKIIGEAFWNNNSREIKKVYTWDENYEDNVEKIKEHGGELIAVLAMKKDSPIITSEADRNKREEMWFNYNDLIIEKNTNTNKLVKQLSNKNNP